jgi:hypothetical protein
MPILEEVAQWKLEAKLEDNRRCFYNTADVDLLASGARSFVIGRKGTGKTAIREHLIQNPAPQRFAEKLTFKNFPFNDLLRIDTPLSDRSFAPAFRGTEPLAP